jgi:hypothetical protein
MERVDGPKLVPATSFLTTMSTWYARLVENLRTPLEYDVWEREVAFSDDLERRMIERELHARS